MHFHLKKGCNSQLNCVSITELSPETLVTTQYIKSVQIYQHKWNGHPTSYEGHNNALYFLGNLNISTVFVISILIFPSVFVKWELPTIGGKSWTGIYYRVLSKFTGQHRRKLALDSAISKWKLISAPGHARRSVPTVMSTKAFCLRSEVDFTYRLYEHWQCVDKRTVNYLEYVQNHIHRDYLFTIYL